MPERMPNPREMGRYFALAQVGLEMVVPIGVGLWIDGQWGTGPWGVIVGTVLGFGGGLLHLVLMLNRWDRPGSSPPERDET